MSDFADNVDGILAVAEHICNKNPNLKGYQMGAGHDFKNIDGEYYDCSGFVLTCVNRATHNIGGATYTGDMVAALTSIREGGRQLWEHHSYADVGRSGLKKGDVLVWNEGNGAGANGHTELVYTDGGGQLAGAHSTATGVNIKAWSYRSPEREWQDVLRYTKNGFYPVKVTPL